MKKKLKISVARELSEALSPQIEVKAPVVDRLVYVLPWNVGLQFAQSIPDEMQMRVQEEVESGRAAYLPSKGSNYRLSLRLNLPDEASARISLGATRVSQKGGLRIDITPSKMSEAAIKAMHKTIKRLLDLEREEYQDLAMRATVNRMDVAVDVLISLDRLLVGYRGAHELTVFGKRFKSAVAETLNFGSVSSAYRAAVYDKGIQLTHELVLELRKAGDAEDLKSNLVRQVQGRKEGRPITR
ncbi:unnamed protein product, partial [Brugia timori]|uniref:Trigger factor n=1 Tax=Brugia timori TaxID=42155 RepID=A0A0R3QI40_9BILA